jgi:putative ABC transport system permease protein
MMLNLFKENVHCGRFHKNPNITYFTHRIDYRNRITALVGILTVVSALENTISSDFASMGSNTFNVKQYENTTQTGGEERKIINPIVSYTEAVDFKDEYDYPFTQTSPLRPLLMQRYEATKTDPEIAVIGVDEHFMTNSV